MHKGRRHGTPISISPLELLTIAFLVYLVGKIPGRDELLDGGTRFVGRSDNSSTCSVINSSRLSSAYMSETLDAVIAAERTVGLHVQLQHIPAEDNEIADHLSHGRQPGRIEKALALIEPRFGKPCCITIPPTFVAVWEKRVREACRNREAVAEARDTEALGQQEGDSLGPPKSPFLSGTLSASASRVSYAPALSIHLGWTACAKRVGFIQPSRTACC